MKSLAESEHEREQKRRIEERQEEEAAREKKLVLSGQVEMTRKHLRDPELRRHHRLLVAEEQVASRRRRGRSTSPTVTRSRSLSPRKKTRTAAVSLERDPDGGTKSKKKTKKGRKKAPVSKKTGRLKWADEVNDSNLMRCEREEQDTVIARLVYDEKEDEIYAIQNGSPTAVEGSEQQRRKTGNPVYKAFEGANGVDELFEIAELIVNPQLYP